MNKKYQIPAAIAFLIGTASLIPVAAFAQAQSSIMLRLMDATARTGLPGYTRISNVRARTGMLESSREIELSFRLRKGQKYGFVAVGDNNATDVDVRIQDQNGQVIELDDDDDATAYIPYTAEENGIYDVVVTMYNCENSECAYALGAYKK
ncbi:MAG TPA: hypothetical protein DDW76_02035 [Cyanobacteria bacterium UBA11369]|nr:hypothetical protein [Cyanobacteria bacterium UBA8553]HAJ64781.1 hypothetical protein [Cyanobacteria bacterium UBA8543]HAZ42986.1 hypothetical protein [Cyanobacteria bacterium UBA11371]HBE32590.1 hypothetical protein [Cyanobacteria bacterium UBA11368]HBE47609.1 hypothetical protein [Cyanobacteria bacterium UBA11369]